MALSLNNANAILSALVTIPDYPFSLVGWFRVPDNSKFTALMGITSTSTGERCEIYFAGDSTKEAVAATYTTSSSSLAYSTSPMIPGQWHHLVAVFASDNERKIFIDGGNLGVNNDNLAISALSFIYFGNLYGPDLVDVAEVSIIQAAVSADQAAFFANGGPLFSSPNISAMVTYHDCIRQANQPGLGPKFIVIGSPVATAHPRKIHAVSGHSIAMPYRVRGPWRVEQSLGRSLSASQGQLSASGVASNNSILSGEVTV